jgi:hypothetical protein
MNSFREAPEQLVRIADDGIKAIAFNHPSQSEIPFQT